jgi:hypothetical protein
MKYRVYLRETRLLSCIVDADDKEEAEELAYNFTEMKYDEIEVDTEVTEIQEVKQ